MKPTIQKLIPDTFRLDAETMQTLVSGRGFRLELIHSFGNASDPEFWYDQETVEWVALVQGSATLEFDDGTLELESGDALVIEARHRHRVASASVDAVWIALHFDPNLLKTTP